MKTIKTSGDCSANSCMIAAPAIDMRRYLKVATGICALGVVLALLLPTMAGAQKLNGTVKDCAQVSCADIPPPASTPPKSRSTTPDPLEQCALLLFASLFFLLSGAKPLEGLRWRKQGRQVDGTVLNVVQTKMHSRSGPIIRYWPIYHFALADGQTYAGILDRAISEKQPEPYGIGTKAALLVFPSQPTKVRRADTLIFDGVDIVFLLLGALLIYVAATIHSAVTPQFWMMLAALGVLLLVQLCRVFVPDKEPPPGSAVVTADNRDAEKQLRPATELPVVILAMISVPLLLLLAFNYFQPLREWFGNP